MPSVRERELARVINQSWKPLERWAVSPGAKQALAGGLSPFTGTQRFLAWDMWLKSIEGVNDPLKAETQLSMAARSADIRGVGASLSFNVLDEVSQRYAASQAGLLVEAVSSGQKQVIQKVIHRAMSGEITVDTAARHLKGAIGLHPAWADAVAKYGDHQFQRLLDDGLKMDKAAARAEAMQERYRKRLVGARSRNIARTEIATANNVGQYAAYGQAVEDGYAHPQSLKEWAPGPGACGICGPMSGEKVQWDQPFSNGKMMPPGHPGCRCSTNLLDPTREYRGIDHTNPKGDRLTAENMATRKPVAPPPKKRAPRKRPTPETPLNPNVPNQLTDDLMPVQRGNPLPVEQAGSMNPNRGNPAYADNCSSCSTAYEMRRRGYDVQAAGGVQGKGRFDTEYVNQWWKNADGSPATVDYHADKKSLKGWVEDQPPGARGYIMVSWKKGGGHVFNWEKMPNGTVRYIDGQANRGTGIVEYADFSPKTNATTKTVRIDDKIPTKDVAKAVEAKQVPTKAPPKTSRAAGRQAALERAQQEQLRLLNAQRR